MQYVCGGVVGGGGGGGGHKAQRYGADGSGDKMAARGNQISQSIGNSMRRMWLGNLGNAGSLGDGCQVVYDVMFGHDIDNYIV